MKSSSIFLVWSNYAGAIDAWQVVVNAGKVILWHSWFFQWYGNWSALTYWGRTMHICVRKLTMIGSDNGLSTGRRQAIIWTNAGILFIGPLGANFSDILIIQDNTLEHVVCEMASVLSLPQCVNHYTTQTVYIFRVLNVHQLWCLWCCITSTIL